MPSGIHDIGVFVCGFSLVSLDPLLDMLLLADEFVAMVSLKCLGLLSILDTLVVESDFASDVVVLSRNLLGDTLMVLSSLFVNLHLFSVSLNVLMCLLVILSDLGSMPKAFSSSSFVPLSFRMVIG